VLRVRSVPLVHVAAGCASTSGRSSQPFDLPQGRVRPRATHVVRGRESGEDVPYRASPESAYLSAFGMLKAYTLLLPIPGAMLRYPEPQYTVPFTIDGASMTEPPLAKVKRTAPVPASSACIAPEYDPAYTTPFATLTAPGSPAPGVGSGTCHRILPVRGSRAAQEPQLIVGPPFASVYGRCRLLEIAT